MLYTFSGLSGFPWLHGLPSSMGHNLIGRQGWSMILTVPDNGLSRALGHRVRVALRCGTRLAFNSH